MVRQKKAMVSNFKIVTKSDPLIIAEQLNIVFTKIWQNEQKIESDKILFDLTALWCFFVFDYFVVSLFLQ